MKVNHENTKKKILEITSILKNQANSAKTFKKNKALILQDEARSEKYKTDAVAELAKGYYSLLEDTKKKLIEHLEEIIPLELENEAILQFDIPEYLNTVTTITSAKKELSADVINTIKLNFAGHYQVLNSIASILKSNDISPEQYGYSEYTRSVTDVIPGLISMAENLEQEENNAIISLHNFFKAIIRFGEVRGVAFSESEKNFGEGIDDEAKETLIRRSMGLPEVN